MNCNSEVGNVLVEPNIPQQRVNGLHKQFPDDLTMAQGTSRKPFDSASTSKSCTCHSTEGVHCDSSAKSSNDQSNPLQKDSGEGKSDSSIGPLEQVPNLLTKNGILEKHLEKLNLKSLELDSSPTLVQAEDTAEHIVSASNGICYARYKSELQMPAIMHLITKDLSEPYSIYTYRYFIHNWPNLCLLAINGSHYVGAIVCKLDLHKKITRRGYIAMLAVDESVRRKKIGSNLVKMAIEAMTDEGCDEVVLETEVTNHSALKLYENLGFVRDKRLFRYYLNGVDALRLKLWLC